ncbi:unnamed protein product [Arctogadus glacialis]
MLTKGRHSGHGSDAQCLKGSDAQCLKGSDAQCLKGAGVCQEPSRGPLKGLVRRGGGVPPEAREGEDRGQNTPFCP